MTTDILKWDHRFLRLAEHVAQWSKDPSTQVGCVLVNDQRIVVGMGYNGFPRGVDDNGERYRDRAVKYLMVQHAEANAILNASATIRGATAYVTHPCCSSCMGLLIQAGVSRVVTRPAEVAMAQRFAESFGAAQVMASEAGVRVALLHARGPA
jgi:dCMP deaminase